MAERKTMFQCEECSKWFFSMDIFCRHACCVNASQQMTAPADEFSNAGILIQENSTEEDVDTQIQVQQELQQSLSWSKSATLLLISLYKNKQLLIDTGKMRKNKAFGEISDNLKEHGYYFNSQQCASSLKTIARAYKNIKDHNNKSGNNRKTYEYENELNDLYKNRPNIEPEFVISTITSTQQNAKDVPEIHPETKSAHNKRGAAESETEGNPSAPKSRKTQVSEVITFIQEMTKNQEERHKNEQTKREERHREKMSVFKDLIDVLKEKSVIKITKCHNPLLHIYTLITCLTDVDPDQLAHLRHLIRI